MPLIFILITFGFLTPLRLVLWAGLVKWLWASFIVTGFNAPAMTLPTALGIMLIASVLTWKDHLGKKIDEDDMLDHMVSSFFNTLLVPVILGTMALVIRLLAF